MMNKKIFNSQDKNLQSHNFRVGKISYEFAKYIGLHQREAENVMIGGLFHDIGKIMISQKILNKPAKLTKEEFEKIKVHPTCSYMILRKRGYPEAICKIVKHHHENYNGTGYPDGLKEKEIPFGSRILRVADIFDALTSNRVYRNKLTAKEALLIMEDQKHHFHPFVYEKFKNFIKKEGNILYENSNISREA